MNSCVCTKLVTAEVQFEAERFRRLLVHQSFIMHLQKLSQKKYMSGNGKPMIIISKFEGGLTREEAVKSNRETITKRM